MNVIYVHDNGLNYKEDVLLGRKIILGNQNV